jgi:hypothetical protein
MPDAEPSLPLTLDSVLRKYGKIWIWSILSAAIAALSMRTMGAVLQIFTVNMQFNGRNGFGFPTGFMLLGLLPSTAEVFALYYLLQFLRHHLLPILFPRHAATDPGFTLTGAPAGAVVLAEPQEDTGIPDGASILFRAFAATVIAVGLEVAMAFFAVGVRILS